MLYNIPNISSKDDILKRIKFIFHSSGLNQSRFAKQLNISQAAVSKYLNERIPPPDILLKIAYLGNTTIEWLLTGKINIHSEENLVQDKIGDYKTKIQENLAGKIAKLEPPLKVALETVIDKLIAGE